MAKLKSNKGITMLAVLMAGSQMLPTNAFAYVGPGAGLTMLGSLIAVLLTVLVAILGIVLFPLRALMKRRRAKSPDGAAQPSERERSDDGGLSATGDGASPLASARPRPSQED
jgi:hypothetical protein